MPLYQRLPPNDTPPAWSAETVPLGHGQSMPVNMYGTYIRNHSRKCEDSRRLQVQKEKGSKTKHNSTMRYERRPHLIISFSCHEEGALRLLVYGTSVGRLITIIIAYLLHTPQRAKPEQPSPFRLICGTCRSVSRTGDSAGPPRRAYPKPDAATSASRNRKAPPRKPDEEEPAQAPQ